MSEVIYEVGQQVRIRANTCGHYFKTGDIVTIKQTRGNGEPELATKGDQIWFLDRDDVEPLEGYVPKGAKLAVFEPLQEKPAPAPQATGKLVYAVTNKDGILELAEFREDARLLKAYLGGKKAGISIVAYAPVKEIR